MTKTLLTVFIFFLTLTSCSHLSFTPSTAQAIPLTEASQLTSLDYADHSSLWQLDNGSIWYKLQHTSLTKLETTLTTATDPLSQAWLKLAIISKQFSLNTTRLTQALTAWRHDYPTHPANSLFPSDHALTDLAAMPIPQHIAMLIPLTGPFKREGQMVRDGFLSAYYATLSQHPAQTLSFYDTATTSSINEVYQQALQQGADFIIGPLTKDKVEELLHNDSFPIPTLELNYTDIWLGSLPTNLYQFGLSPLDEASQAATKARQAHLDHALVIAPDNDWGKRVVKAFTDQWQALNGTISDSLYIKPADNLVDDIAALLHIDPKVDQAKKHAKKSTQELRAQLRRDFDVIFLFAEPTTARQVVPMLKFYYVDNTPIYGISSLYSGNPNPAKDNDLNGVTFCDIPWILQPHPKHSGRSNRLFAVGHDAYFLSLALPRLQALANFPLYAATGALSLTEKQQIYRRLPWVTMHAGQP